LSRSKRMLRILNDQWAAFNPRGATAVRTAHSISQTECLSPGAGREEFCSLDSPSHLIHLPLNSLSSASRSHFVGRRVSSCWFLTSVGFVSPVENPCASRHRPVIPLPARISLPIFFVLLQNGFPFLWRP
jgi:hypothetical protein